MPDFEEFEMETKNIRELAEKFLEFWFGKCSDYYEECEGCKRWKALEDLLKNPFNKGD